MSKQQNKPNQKSSSKKQGEGNKTMTMATRQAIIDSKFDFASVAGCMSDIRRSFWILERTNEFYRNKVAELHSHFYQQIVPGRQEERDQMEQELKKGGFMSKLKLIEKKKKQENNMRPKFDSGSEGSCAGEAPDADEFQFERQDSEEEMVPVENNGSFNPIVMRDRRHESLPSQPSFAAISRLGSGRKQVEKGPSVNTTAHLYHSSNINVGGMEDIEKGDGSGRGSIGIRTFESQPSGIPDDSSLNINKSMSVMTQKKMVAQFPASKQKSQLGHRTSKRHNTTLSSLHTMAEEDFLPDDLTDEQFHAEIMSDSKLRRVTFIMFEKKLKNPFLRQKIASDLALKLKHIKDYRADDIMKVLEHTDKELLIQFRDAKITLNQYKARINERLGVAKYKVLEDIWPELPDVIKQEIKKNPNLHHQIYGKNATVEDLQRPLEDWELNPRCLKSIKYHHKKGVKRKHDREESHSSIMLDDVNNSKSRDSVQMISHAKKEKSMSMEPVGSTVKHILIDERSLKTKKAREKKESEIKKYVQNIHSMKQKLAKAIIDKALKVEDMQKLTLEDLFKHASDREKALADKTVHDITSSMASKSKEERQRAMWQKMDTAKNKHLAQSAAYYSSKFELPQDISSKQAEVLRLKAKLDDKFFFQQEKANRMQNAFELISVYKVLYDIEQEVKAAQATLKESQDAAYLASRGPPKQQLAFLKMLNESGAYVLVDKKARKQLNIRDSLDQAIAEDLQEMESDDKSSEADSSEDEITREEKRTKKLMEQYAVPSNTTILMAKVKERKKRQQKEKLRKNQLSLLESQITEQPKSVSPTSLKATHSNSAAILQRSSFLKKHKYQPEQVKEKNMLAARPKSANMYAQPDIRKQFQMPYSRPTKCSQVRSSHLLTPVNEPVRILSPAPEVYISRLKSGEATKRQDIQTAKHLKEDESEEFSSIQKKPSLSPASKDHTPMKQKVMEETSGQGLRAIMEQREIKTQRTGEQTSFTQAVASKRQLNSTARSYSLQRYQSVQKGPMGDQIRFSKDMQVNSIVDEQRKLESTMSATMINFVHMYGIQVQPAARNKSPQLVNDDLFDIPQTQYHTGTNQRTRPQTSNILNTKYRSSFQQDGLQSASYNLSKPNLQQLNALTASHHHSQAILLNHKSSTKSVPRAVNPMKNRGNLIQKEQKQEDGVIESIMRSVDGSRTSKNDFRSKFNKSKVNIINDYASTKMSETAPESQVNNSRAMRSNRSLRKPSQRRQDNSFNSLSEIAEKQMRSNNTALLRQRLSKNMMSVKINREGNDVAKIMKTNLIAQQAEYAVSQAGNNDYATKAIAQRLRLLSEKRSQLFQKKQSEISAQPQPIMHKLHSNYTHKDVWLQRESFSSPHILMHQVTGDSGILGRQQTEKLTDFTPQDRMVSKAFAWTNQNKQQTLKMSTVDSGDKMMSLAQFQISQGSEQHLQFQKMARAQSGAPAARKTQQQQVEETLRASLSPTNNADDKMVLKGRNNTNVMLETDQSNFDPEDIPISSKRQDSRPPTAGTVGPVGMNRLPSAASDLLWNNQD